MKKLFLTRTLFLVLFIVSSISVSAGGVKLKNGNWNRLSVNSLAIVNYKYVNCDLPSQGTHQEMVYLQFKNLSKKTIVISYDLLKFYNNKCVNCEENAEGKHFVIELAPGQSLEGACDSKNNQGIKIFSKMLDFEASSVLTDFEISNFNVKIK